MVRPTVTNKRLLNEDTLHSTLHDVWPFDLERLLGTQSATDDACRQ